MRFKAPQRELHVARREIQRAGKISNFSARLTLNHTSDETAVPVYCIDKMTLLE